MDKKMKSEIESITKDFSTLLTDFERAQSEMEHINRILVEEVDLLQTELLDINVQIEELIKRLNDLKM